MPLKNVSLYLFINTWSAPSYTSTEVAVQREGQRCPYSRVAEAALWATLTLCCRQDMRGPRDCGSTHADTSNAATDCYWNNTKMCVLSLPGRLSFQGCICPSASKRSPSSLPLEPSSVQSHGNAAVTALQTFLYRLFKGSLRLSSAEQEVGPLEHEPAVCSCSIESQEHPELYYKKHCQKASGGDPRPQHWWDRPGALCPSLGSPARQRQGDTGESPVKDHHQWSGASAIQGEAARDGTAQPGEGSQRTLSTTKNTWGMDAFSSGALWQEAMGTNWNMWNSTENKQFFTAGGDKSIGTGCPVRLWILDPWEIFKTQPDIAHGNLLQLTLLWAGEMD